MAAHAELVSVKVTKVRAVIMRMIVRLQAGGPSHVPPFASAMAWQQSTVSRSCARRAVICPLPGLAVFPSNGVPIRNHRRGASAATQPNLGESELPFDDSKRMLCFLVSPQHSPFSITTQQQIYPDVPYAWSNDSCPRIKQHVALCPLWQVDRTLLFVRRIAAAFIWLG
jgi:hypothetical protein